MTDRNIKLKPGMWIKVQHRTSGAPKQQEVVNVGPDERVIIQRAAYVEPTPEPEPEPTPEPPPTTTCTRVATAPTSGDATTALNIDVRDTPNGGTLCLAPGATYQLNGELHIDTRSNITIDGRGATLKRPAPTGTSLLGIRIVNGITVRNLTLDGAKPFVPGDLSLEQGHGIRFDGSTAGLFDNVRVLNVGGDGILLGAGFVGSTRVGSDGFEFRNGLIDGTGRNAVSITDGGDNMHVHHSTMRHIGYYTFDIEPNGFGLGGKHCRFNDNALGPGAYAYVPAVHGYLFAVTGSSGGGPAEDVEFSRNLITGQPFRIGVFNNGGTRRDIKVVGNRTDTPSSAIPKQVTFGGVVGLTVTDNIGFSDTEVSTSGCTGVTVTRNA